MFKTQKTMSELIIENMEVTNIIKNNKEMLIRFIMKINN